MIDPRQRIEEGTVETRAESFPDTSEQAELVIGLLASPGPASELTESLVEEIADRLAVRLPGVRWRIEFVSDRLGDPPTDLSALIAAGRRMLLERGWHLVVCVTDLPLQTARRPVIAHASATHGVAVLSMPALGPVWVRRRAAETIVRLVGQILGDLAPTADAAEPLAAGAAAHARAGRGLRGRGVRAGDQRHLAARPLSRGAAAHRHLPGLGRWHRGGDRGHHR